MDRNAQGRNCFVPSSERWRPSLVNIKFDVDGRSWFCLGVSRENCRDSQLVTSRRERFSPLCGVPTVTTPSQLFGPESKR